MHVLTATRQSQGDRPDDFCFTVEGELVRLSFDRCDCPECGCDRSFAGLGSSRATTTALVLDHPAYTRQTYRQAVVDGLTRQGFVDPGDPESVRWAEGLADTQLAIAAFYTAGTVVEASRDEVRPRSPLPSA